MIENFQAIIGAKIRDFQRKMKQVDKQVRETAFEATKPIGADIKEFQTKMAKIQATAKRVLKRGEKEIGADTSSFMRKAAEIAVVARTLSRDKIVIPVKISIQNYKNVMGRIANFNRAMGEIMQMTAQGIMTSLSPTIVPIIASLVGLLGQLGPMLGAIGGSTFALASAFFFAGTAAVAFGAAAIPTISKLFDENEKLTKSQQTAKNELTKLQKTWQGVVKDLEKPVLEAFGKSMQFANTALKMARPLFDGAATASNNLLSSLNASLDSPPIKAFFDYMNKQAGPLFETTGKAVGYVLQGLLSMFTAFGPLAEKTAAGFLDMTKRFADWAAGLSESKKFQSFVDYVNENMPKIRNIFGDAFKGIINMFAAFAPSSADMMTSLEDMMARFKEWSSTLSKNKGFQNFIDYVKDNGPRVVDLIGNLTTFLVNLGVALAPMGSKMLDLVNRFLEWSSAMIENHPWIGKIAAAALVLGGAFFAALPHITGMITLFGGLINPMILASARMIATAVTFIGRWALMGAQALLHAARMAAAWFIALGPIGWVIAAVIGLVVLVIANWDKVSEATIRIWTAVSEFMSNAVAAILGYIQTNFPMIYEIISQGMESAKEIITAVWEYIKATFTNVLNLLKALVSGDFESMKRIISEQLELAKATIERIWNAVKEYFGTILNVILRVVLDKFIEIVKNVSNKMNETKTTISNKWEEAKAAAISKITAMVSSVVKFFSNIVTNVKTKMSDAKNAVMNKWEEAKTATSTKLTALVSSVLTFFGDVVSTVKEKMVEAVTEVGTQIGKMPGKVREKASEMLSAGKDLIQGLINGILDMGSKAIEAVTGVVDGVINKAKSLLGIKSPSRVFMAIGDDTGQGWAIGIAATRKANQKAVEGVAKVIKNAARLANDEINKLQKKQAVDEKAIIDKKNRDIANIRAVAASKKRKLTLQEAQRIQKLEIDASSKILNIRKKSVTDIAKVEQSAHKERLDAIKLYIDDKKSMEEMSLVAEALVWDKALATFKAGTKERVDAQKAYKNAVEAVNKEIIAINTEYSNKMQSINDELAKNEQQLNDEYNKAYSSRVDDIRNFAGMFDEFVSKFEGNGQTLLNNLRSQVVGLEEWRETLESLWSKIDDQSLMEELEALGPKAAGELKALNGLTEAELSEYVDLYNQKFAHARDQATHELSGMKEDTEKNIIDMREAANKELAKLEKDWVKRIQSVAKATDDELMTLKQVGVDAGKGLMDGLASMEGALIDKATSIAESIKKAMAGALDIHSPSRWMRDFIGKNMMFGWINGIEAMRSKVVAMAETATDWMKPDVPVLAGVNAPSFDHSRQLSYSGRDTPRPTPSKTEINDNRVMHVSIEASRVKEFNDVVKLFDEQEWNSD